MGYFTGRELLPCKLKFDGLVVSIRYYSPLLSQIISSIFWCYSLSIADELCIMDQLVGSQL